jgi:hypothetical protein
LHSAGTDGRRWFDRVHRAGFARGHQQRIDGSHLPQLAKDAAGKLIADVLARLDAALQGAGNYAAGAVCKTVEMAFTP